MTRRVTFKQADMTRALLGVQAAGKQVSQIHILPSGEIRIVVDDSNHVDEPNPLDRLHRN